MNTEPPKPRSAFKTTIAGLKAAVAAKATKPVSGFRRSKNVYLRCRPR